MLKLLEELCRLDGISGDEGNVRDFILSQLDGHCDTSTDALGNIIAFKKGQKSPKKKIMLDAHMDEVGLMVTSVTADGFLKFKTVGGIDTSAIMFRQVRLNGKINGVIGGKPIHLTDDGERKKLPDTDSLYIDIGADSKEEALNNVSIGDSAVICGYPELVGNNILSKALDDRIGCAVLITLLREYDEYDFYAVFSVQEEVGLRGAKTAAFAVKPDAALVLEATTAADIAEVPEDHTVCKLGLGPAVSFMDRATVYDRSYYCAALESGIKCQPKCYVSGGNNSGAIHISGSGVRTLAISAPCRYIHTAVSAANTEDIENMLALSKYMLSGIAGGEIE